jgi:hypothetical protein
MWSFLSALSVLGGETKIGFVFSFAVQPAENAKQPIHKPCFFASASPAFSAVEEFAPFLQFHELFCADL